MTGIPMRPPKIPGYDFVQLLGSGATATVYLYNQRMPVRPVAVKVSAKTLDPRAAALFNREANFMAKLSSHPYILPVYGAGVTSDGHGYIIIEYAPGGTYNSVMKARSMTCDQVLDLGIKLSSALFTAHRANIIHHDIKPSNILITAQGLPVLADFGISTDVYDRTETGFSPPWAPPEVLQHLTNGSEAADIYSLAATLYAMFVGYSPFQHEYHPHTQSELISLIINQPLPRLNRPDVPADVEAVLRRALNKNPDQRYYSALEFARAMQRVQFANFGHATPVTVEGMPPYPKDIERPRNGNAPTVRSTVQNRAWIKPAAIATAVAAAIVAVALVFVYGVLPRLDSTSGAETKQLAGAGTQDNDNTLNQQDDTVTGTDDATVPSPEHLTGTYAADGSSVTFTWTNPDQQQGDSYAWALVQGDGTDQSTQTTTTSDTTVTVDPQDGQQTCIQVSIVRKNHQMSATPTIGCAAKPQ
ncbi:serine/threonine-protein kinase [Bifidobacterium scaligerum]|uniref:non-specific serine/threonine protein kinase n=1 Tax=Bifidobacterium scaligerum TaxID=2052656 RepID=A0A2M9HPG0_9BIFI|nr:serine/threonine-protein kinase [Bifidobacterium scaligerum]PJM78697.1 serine/threonine protein kinase [Bifidobacterium scaligerum]